jgi:hypothetical protein
MDLDILSIRPDFPDGNTDSEGSSVTGEKILRISLITIPNPLSEDTTRRNAIIGEKDWVTLLLC